MIILLSLAPWVAAAQPSRAGEPPQIIAFDGNDFTGDHTHIVGDLRRLGKWDNSISSLIILSGTWEFFDGDDFTGTKMATKAYHWYTRYPGGYKTAYARDLIQTDPERILREAVKRMVPRNKLGRQQMTKLKIYAGTQHPHQAQQPVEFKLS